MTDPDEGSFRVVVGEGTLVAGDVVLLAEIRFNDWLDQATAALKAAAT